MSPWLSVVFFSVRVFPTLISKNIPFYALKFLKDRTHLTSAKPHFSFLSKLLEEQVGSSSVPRRKEAGIQLASRPGL